MQGRETVRVAKQAMDRYPDEPRFVLSRAIASDQAHASRPPSRSTERETGLPDARDVETAYEAALKVPDVAPEARIRYAYFLHRTNRPTAALQHLAAVEGQHLNDVDLRYLRQLFLGHVLLHLRRVDEATAAYKEAQAIVPGSQSSAVGIMNTLIMKGDREGAEAIAEAIQGEATRPLDPWWSYWQGQYRFHPQAMARMRELSR